MMQVTDTTTNSLRKPGSLLPF
uniref:Uncharacterized protein n=1 Tax=Arundo donax TaxID=35708 RepID=A0A0A9BZL0_ARUDO